MSTTLVLNSNPLPQPAMDFQALRKEAIRQAQALSGKSWTDFNAHDPGLTILDQLVYALTDLSYRIDFDIEDLMAREDGLGQAGMFSPAAILPARPNTLADYRKLMIDVPGVRNAWIETVAFPLPKVFHYTEDQTFRIEDNEGSERISIKGLYRALVEPEPGYPEAPSGILQRVKAQLLANRNLCEDFFEVRLLPVQPIRVVMEIEVGHIEDLPKLAQEIFQRISAFIAPELPKHSLQEMLAKGYRVDEIFDGPLPSQGFIDDQDLAQHQRRTELRSSDLIQVLMNIPGITVVRDIHLRTSTGKVERWLLPLDPAKSAQLDLVQSSVTFFKEDLLAGTYRPVEGAIKPVVHEALSPWELDILPSKKRHRRIADYYSLQHHFPAAYGLGNNRLHGDSSPRRVAQVQQLKGYLLLFEQILANFFQQASEAASLFSFTESEARTYFSQLLFDQVPGAAEVLNAPEPVLGLRHVFEREWVFNPGEIRPDVGSTLVIEGPYGSVAPVEVLDVHENGVRLRFPEEVVPPNAPNTWRYTSAYLETRLQGITETETQALSRKNKFLNHIMARFSEQLTEYALLLHPLEPGENRAARRAMNDKLAFLRDYVQVSRDRAAGLNYLQAYDSPDNLPGFMRRILRMLGIPNMRIQSLSEAPIEWMKANLIFQTNRPQWTKIWAQLLVPEQYRYETKMQRVFLYDTTGDLLAYSNESLLEDQIPDLKARWQAEIAALNEQGEGLHLVEHLLLRPRTVDEESGLHVLFQEKLILDFASHPETPGGYVCTCPDHGLSEGMEILLRRQGEPELRLKATFVTAESFVLVLKNPPREDGAPYRFIRVQYPADPYSLQLTVMLPDWPRRNQDENFRKLVEKTIRSEAPAHLKVYLQWLDLGRMHDFEHCHFMWLSQLSQI